MQRARRFAEPLPIADKGIKMAELTMTTFLSLDGVMQGPGGPDEDRSGGFARGGWVVPHIDEAFGKVIEGIFAKAEAFLLGRTTYDLFASYWPKVTDPNDTVASRLNTLPKFVVSRSRSEFPWEGASAVRDVEKELAGIKQRFAGELQVHGSAGLAQTLIAKDLVDEYRLLIFPVVLGSGKRLFGTGTIPRTLKLISSQTTGTGVTVAFYRRAGDLKTGAVPPAA